MTGPGAMVSNHVSWLDCFALNAGGPLYFVSKSEVGSWPGIGWLAHATGTVFIRRNPRDAQKQRSIFEDRLRAGHRLLFFPEGTSTDGRRVLDFKSTLFAAFFINDFRHDMAIQPIALRYVAPPGAPPTFYGWWGDMAFGPHLLDVLSAKAGGQVEVIYHEPLPVAAMANRKTLAQVATETVRKAISASAEPRTET
ncbi:lysophospholipid acyltransferase family protein [Palleronia sp. LCG004]|uniref:lysophospholipid acyltransferase family protein n=1 Tax=Palleronia sp. LCG004 TaxID=3079304 RepID=UPI002943D520|nr:lysophospholipid acyltransferase family protein [Palleronia sp. LCG004]WOI56994.1 lysophospholipid acyltransferase family protein [Palleronia sp. LCG004]